VEGLHGKVFRDAVEVGVAHCHQARKERRGQEADAVDVAGLGKQGTKTPVVVTHGILEQRKLCAASRTCGLFSEISPAL
jgi:hypothetical protein